MRTAQQKMEVQQETKIEIKRNLKDVFTSKALVKFIIVYVYLYTGALTIN